MAGPFFFSKSNKLCQFLSCDKELPWFLAEIAQKRCRNFKLKVRFVVLVFRRALLSVLVIAGLAAPLAFSQSSKTPVIGENNTTYSPQNFSGRWKVRQPDKEICIVDLVVTDARPHDLSQRACTDETIKAASQWEMRDRDLVFFAKDGKEIGVFKVTAPNTLEGAGLVIFR